MKKNIAIITIAFLSLFYSQNLTSVDDYIGELTITDKNNRVVQYVEVFEIVSSPNHSTINVSEFASGEYTFVLKTKIRSYSSKITIQ